MLDGVVAPFAEMVKSVELHAPQIPFVSNLSGHWITDAEATDAAYWARHLRETVRFADGVGELRREHPDCILLEVGPSQTLAPLARQCSGDGSGVIVSSLQEKRDDTEAIRTALGRLWLEGVAVDWAGCQTGERRRVPLPTYPFERKRFWIEAPSTKQNPAATEAPHLPPEIMPSEPVPEPVAPLPVDRKPAIAAKIRVALKNLSGQDHASADANTSFLEMGFDSLLLTQVAQAFRKEFGVKVTFRQLLEDSRYDGQPSQEYLDEQLPPEVPAVATKLYRSGCAADGDAV